jgi:hypothetical protein
VSSGTSLAKKRAGVLTIWRAWPIFGEDQKAIVFGAVDYANGRVLWQTCPRKGETAFIAFLFAATSRD